MTQDKKKPPLRGMNDLRKKLREYDELEEKARRDKLPSVPKPKMEAEYEGAVGTFEGLLPVAPRDFVPRNKADRRRIPARVRATFRGRAKDA